MAPKPASIKWLLVLTAAIEAVTGICMLASPSLLVQLLVGVSIDTPGGLVVTRVAGAALLSLGLACWLARDDGQTRAGRGVLAALLLYNVGAVIALFHAHFLMELSGVGLLPTVLVHLMLAMWCIASLRIANVGAKAQDRDRPNTTPVSSGD